ncbi:YugN family protein [Ectobacillus polymachus]|uniref:YugN family protein n=1 Tax=Ectobacillus polymachus TaxID=1508806 RepID=UPI003A8B536F
MQFEHTEINQYVIEFDRLQDIMKEYGFILAGQWDYERVTFDYKFTIDTDYYLRIQGEAIEGEIGSNDAIVKLRTPILGKHYYPHGVEYDETFPDSLIERCNDLLQRVSKSLTALET